jgi:hypothetical protein
MLREKW